MKLDEVLTESKSCKFCNKEATQRLVWADGRGQVSICDKHEQKARDAVNKNKHPEIVGVKPI